MARGSGSGASSAGGGLTVALGATVTPPKTALLALPIVLLLAASPVLAQETNLPPGWIPPTSIGLFDEPQLLRKLANSSDGTLTGEREPQDGPYAEMGNMITGSGWLSAGPGYRRHVLGGAALVDMSASLSTNLYKMAQGRIQWPHIANDHLALGAQASTGTWCRSTISASARFAEGQSERLPVQRYRRPCNATVRATRGCR